MTWLQTISFHGVFSPSYRQQESPFLLLTLFKCFVRPISQGKPQRYLQLDYVMPACSCWLALGVRIYQCNEWFCIVIDDHSLTCSQMVSMLGYIQTNRLVRKKRTDLIKINVMSLSVTAYPFPWGVAAGASPSLVSGRGQGTPWISRQLIAGPHWWPMWGSVSRSRTLRHAAQPWDLNQRPSNHQSTCSTRWACDHSVWSCSSV